MPLSSSAPYLVISQAITKKKRKPVAYEVEYCGRRSVCNLPTLTVLFRDWVTVVKIDHNLLALKRFD